MATVIEDGTGKGFAARIDADNRVYTRTVEENEFEHAVRNGRAFNVNTEFLTITTAGDNALLYLKNNGDEDIILTGWFIGTGDPAGTATGVGPTVKVIYNPTGGTIISSASPVTLVNRQAGSSETFDITAYKASASGETLTGGLAAPVLFQTQPSAGRVFGSVYLALKKGASLGVIFDLGGLTSAQIYTGFQGFRPESFNFGE